MEKETDKQEQLRPRRKLREALATLTRRPRALRRGATRRARKCMQAAFSAPRSRLGRYRAGKRLRLPEEG